MSQYRLTVDAWHDLDEIGEYLTIEAGERIAARIEDKLFAIFAQIAEHPGLGHARPDLTKRPVAFFPVKPYLVLYGARDVRRILPKRST